MCVLNEIRVGGVTARVRQRVDGLRLLLTVEFSPAEIRSDQLHDLRSAAKEAELYVRYVDEVGRRQCRGCSETEVV